MCYAEEGGNDQVYLLIILQKQMKQKQYARMKGRKQTTREKFKWQPRRTEEKKTHWMLQEAPFSTKKNKKMFGIFTLKIRTLHLHATQ